MAAPATGLRAESRTDSIRSALWPRVNADGPTMSMVLPVTATVPLPLCVPAVAVSLMLRLLLAPPVPSRARAWPFLSVTASTALRMPESALKEIFAPGKARLAPSLTSAVTATSLPARPADGSSVLEKTSCTALARLAGAGGVMGGLTGGMIGGVVGGVDGLMGSGRVPPQPAVPCSPQPMAGWASAAPPPQPARLAMDMAKTRASKGRRMGELRYFTGSLRRAAKLPGVNFLRVALDRK